MKKVKKDFKEYYKVINKRVASIDPTDSIFQTAAQKYKKDPTIFMPENSAQLIKPKSLQPVDYGMAIYGTEAPLIQSRRYDQSHPYDDRDLKDKLNGQSLNVYMKLKRQELKCKSQLAKVIVDSNHNVKKLKQGKTLCVTLNKLILPNEPRPALDDYRRFVT